MIDQLDDQILGLMRQVVERTPAAPDLGSCSARAVIDFDKAGYHEMIDTRATVPSGGVLMPQPAQRRGLRLAVVLASAACLLGLIVVANRGGRTQPTSPVAPPQWTAVADPSGVFKAAQGAIVPDLANGDSQPSPHGIYLGGVASTSHGLVAVGAEQTDNAGVAVVWRSDDGTSWTRVAHDANVFGELHPTPMPAAGSGYQMTAIAEFAGTLVAVGGRYDNPVVETGASGDPGSTSVFEPVVWTSLDGVNWHRETLPIASGRNTLVGGVAAGANGLLAIGSSFPTGEFDTPSFNNEVWYSADGVSWAREPAPRAGGSPVEDFAVNSVVAFGDQFVVAGSDNGRAMSWITTDGSSWTPAPLPDGIVDATSTSSVRSLGTSNGRLAALVSIRSAGQVGTGFSSETGVTTPIGQSEVALWYSDDGRTWSKAELINPDDYQLRDPGPLAAGPQGFVGVVGIFVHDHIVNATVASVDGDKWTIAPTALAGARSSIAPTSNGWIAIGSDIDYSAAGHNTTAQLESPQNTTVWIARH